MSLVEKINADIKSAMLSKDKRKLEALRAVKAAMLLVMTGKDGGDVSETVEIQTLQRLVKQRNEAAAQYEAGNRPELAEEERYQASVIQEYLPEQMSEEKVTEIVKNIIQQTGASGMKDMGKVMGAATKELSGKADNKMISTVVKQLLS
ncbi:MAG: GatB/YqeY domain-containing protein [Bacteroidales bacterium]|nr:GatB/YqeY domain-containing protein [Bacteroidales bacterium]